MDIIREDCIYARQSVDRKDSISIESQIDFCKYELKGGSCKVFKDKEDCSTQEDIFNYPQNDKSEAAENPLPHFSIMTINLTLLSNSYLQYSAASYSLGFESTGTVKSSIGTPSVDAKSFIRSVFGVRTSLSY